MLNGGNGGGGAEQIFPDSGNVVTFPLQDTDPEEESPSNSAASTAFRQDLSQHRDSDGLANGSGNLAGEDSDALCTCEDGEVRFFCPERCERTKFVPKLFCFRTTVARGRGAP